MHFTTLSKIFISFICLQLSLASYTMDLAQLDKAKLQNTNFLFTVIKEDKPGRLELIKKLLNKPIDLNFCHPEFNVTPLRAAIAKKQLDTVKLLLEAGANAQPDQSQLSPLGTTAAYGLTDLVPLLLQYGAQVNATDNSKCSPVVIAAEQERGECLKALLKAGGNTTTLRPDGTTMLGFAAEANHEKIVRILLASGADPDLADANEFTPLKKAAVTGNIATLELLLKHGAHAMHTNGRGSTAAHMAAFHGKVKALTVLIDHCPESLNAQDYIGRTPFFWAAIKGKLDAVSWMLDRNVDLNVTFINGTTLLDWLKSAPDCKAVLALYKNKTKKPKAPNPIPLKKSPKNKNNSKTFAQRKEKSTRESSPIQNTVIAPVSKAPIQKQITLQERTNALNDLLQKHDDHSYVVRHEDKAIYFGYRHINDGSPTDMIYALPTHNSPGGPKNNYHERVTLKRQQFHQGNRSIDIVEHTQPEALERMHGHCFLSKYIDKKGRTITNKLFLGKKLIDGVFVEGMYTLGFTVINKQLTCFHSCFKQKDFTQIMHDTSIEVSEADKALFEKTLNAII